MTIKSLLIILISAFSLSAYAEHHGDATEEMAKDTKEMTEHADGMAKKGDEMMEEAEGEKADDADADAMDDGEDGDAEEEGEDGDAEEETTDAE